VAPFDERYDGFADTISENGDGFFRGCGGFFSYHGRFHQPLRSDSVLVCNKQMLNLPTHPDGKAQNLATPYSTIGTLIVFTSSPPL